MKTIATGCWHRLLAKYGGRAPTTTHHPLPPGGPYDSTTPYEKLRNFGEKYFFSEKNLFSHRNCGVIPELRFLSKIVILAKK